MAKNDDSSSYIDLHNQLKALEERTEQARLKELEAVITDMKEKIALYKISAKDLSFDDKHTTESKNQETVAVKFRDTSGNTWTGRGARPLWLKQKLKDGSKLEDFKIPES